jgi:hypothetical protein
MQRAENTERVHDVRRGAPLRARAAFLALLAVALTVSPGCGYALAGRGSFLPADIVSVGIPMLVNRTPFFDVEQILTEKIRSEFIGRGKYRVMPDANAVDAVLSGEITGISVQPIGFTDQQLASRYQFTLTMKVVFTDMRTAKELWSNAALTFTQEYELTTRSNVALEATVFLDQERTTFDRISNDVARTVVTAILEAF